ncbi:agglutinin biogenesis protein MshJ [Pseudoalteromonas sp. NEC-BIFX-2020_015]|uniref:type II secretion system protein M n=1 Tax=Pseudoalteromonas sp. NEC-BIFX-2020_015 TaxID=2729544 RepID=UPI00146147E4|nr:type II secretion system protein M [Pseudoalteromonas sp. NEC-BIFX-2020_015]NMR25026.1 agglutinin biogenesis protein MshJ [Pseudoalteromonas sp. NEC-BIFX-2020_015]
MKTNSKKSLRSWPLWVKYQTRFEALQLREKYAVLAVGLFLIIYLGCWFLVLPQQESAKLQQDSLKAIKVELQQSQVQFAMLEEALNTDYTKALRQQIINAEQALIDTDERLSAFSQGFVAAESVPDMLRGLLKSHPNVKVLSFKVLPAKGIDVAKLGEQDAQVLFFEHQMILTLEGEYFGLQNYLESLKKNQEKLLIQEFNYQVTAYPNAQLTIQLATVSANEKFLSL